MTKKQSNSYCGTNATIQIVGERWALLIVRDLLYGPRRFSDLLGSIDGVTPKLLTLRLRELEASGVINRDEEQGRRDVWYSLTPAGEALRPVIRELAGWGVRFGPLPEPEDVVTSRRAVNACIAVLNRQDIYPEQPVNWRLDLGDGIPARFGYDGRRWDSQLDDAPGESDLLISSTPLPFVSLLRATGVERAELARNISLSGDAEAKARFYALFEPAAVAEKR